VNDFALDYPARIQNPGAMSGAGVFFYSRVFVWATVIWDFRLLILR
jgi:hypothetical protein